MKKTPVVEREHDDQTLEQFAAEGEENGLKKKPKRRIPFPNEKKHSRGKVRWKMYAWVGFVEKKAFKHASRATSVWMYECAHA